MNLNKKQELVYQVIQDNPGVQNDESALIAAVWRREGWNDSKTLEQNLTKVTRPETISRRRRELYNLGLITYTKEALQEREEAFRNERDVHMNIHATYSDDYENWKRTK